MAFLLPVVNFRLFNFKFAEFRLLHLTLKSFLFYCFVHIVYRVVSSVLAYLFWLIYFAVQSVQPTTHESATVLNKIMLGCLTKLVSGERLSFLVFVYNLLVAIP